MTRSAAWLLALLPLAPGAVRAQDAGAAPALAQQQVCTGHAGAVTAAAWSPDGMHLATACGDGVVRLYSAAEGKLVRELRGHAGATWAVAFTRDGTRVVSGGADGTARIWSVADGVEVHRCDHGRPGGVLHVYVVGDDVMLLLGGNPSPQIWRISDGRKVGDLEGHIDVVWSVANAGGRWVATGSQDRTVRLWDLQTGKSVAAFGDAVGHPANSPNLGPGSPVLCVALSADAQWVAAGHRDGSVNLWSVDGTKERSILISEQMGEPLLGAALSVALSRDGTQIAAGYASGRVICRTVAAIGTGDGEVYRLQPRHSDWAQQLAFSADGTHLASAGWDGAVHCWRVSDHTFLGAGRGHGARIAALTFSPDGKRLLTASGDRTARIWALPGD